MDLRQLRSFAAIAARRSYRAAAADLLVTQPSLSQQIRRLEGELGVELFDRSTRPISLTDAGEHLLPWARRIVHDVEQARDEVREFASEARGRIAVGAMQYLTNLDLPDLLAAFGAEHPEVELGLRVGNTGQLCDLLEAGEVDVAICHSDELDARPQLETELLRLEELVFLLAADDPRGDGPSLAVSALAGAPLITFRAGASIREALNAAFAEAGLEPHVSFESADLPTAVQLVARGLGVALIPRSIAERATGPVRALPVSPQPLTRHVALVRRRDGRRSRALEAFRRDARRAMGSSVLR